MGDSKEEINNVLSSSKRQIATRVTMPQRPICTGMVRGHVNEITFNIDNEIIITRAVDVPKCYEIWGDANFHPILQNAIMKSGYIKPRKKQAFAIFIIANGFDLIHQSESASGKTGAYLLPIIDEMLRTDWKLRGKVPFALIIALNPRTCASNS